MNNETNPKALGAEYMISKQQAILGLIEPVMIYRDNLLEHVDNIFHDDIKSQYLVAIKSMIADHLTKEVNITMEDALLFMEDVNFKGYFHNDKKL